MKPEDKMDPLEPHRLRRGKGDIPKENPIANIRRRGVNVGQGKKKKKKSIKTDVYSTTLTRFTTLSFCPPECFAQWELKIAF